MSGYLCVALFLGLAQALRRKTKKVGGNPAGWSTYPSNWKFLGHCTAPESPGGLLNFEQPACRPGQDTDFGRDAKIAVVGGGPGGASIARLLDDRGFHNVKVFEASDRVGGKSKRYEANGENHELGTCFLTGKYECIQEWGKMVGMHESVMKDNKRWVASDTTVLENMKAPHFGTSNMYAADYAFQQLGIKPTEMKAKIGQAIERYPAEWRATMGDYEYMFPSEDKLNMTALSQTYHEWLVERDLLALLPVLLPTMNGQGYGDPADMPALYGLMWNHPNFVLGGPFGSGSIRMFREGFQTLWERLIERSTVDVSLNSPVKSVRRTSSGAFVTYHRKGRYIEEAFDWVVMAAPMPKALSLVADATAEEKDLFSAYNFHELSMSAFHLAEESTGVLPPDFEILAWSDRLPDQTDYYRMTLEKGNKVSREMYDADGDDGPTAIRHTANIKGFKSQVVGFLQISDFRNTDDNLTQVIKDDALQYGMDVELLHLERWDYMPHYSLSEVVKERKPWRIWDLQGQQKNMVGRQPCEF